MTNTTDVVEATAKMGFHCQVEGYHHAYSDQAKRQASLYVEKLRSEMLTSNERDLRAMLSQIGSVAALQLRSIQSRECAAKLVEGKTGIPSVLYKYIPMKRIGNGAPKSLRATQPSSSTTLWSAASGQWEGLALTPVVIALWSVQSCGSTWESRCLRENSRSCG